VKPESEFPPPRPKPADYAALPADTPGKQLGRRQSVDAIAKQLGFAPGWRGSPTIKDAVLSAVVQWQRARDMVALSRDRQRTALADALEPKDWRGQHDPTGEGIAPGILYPEDAEAAKLGKAQVKDSYGRLGSPSRTVDTIGIMLMRGTITETQWRAGGIFQNQFARAQLEGLKAVDWLKIGGGSGKGPSNMRDSVMSARDDVFYAVRALGGTMSASGACCYHVLGLGESVKEWSERFALSHGRPLSREAASGVLIGVLCSLEAYYGLNSPSKPVAGLLATP
jgi:hypothetical protein